MNRQSRLGILNRLFGASRRETNSPCIRKIGFEPLETRCLLSVSPGLPDAPVTDAVLDSSVADSGNVYVVSGDGYVDYRNDPLSEVLDTDLVRLFREYEAWAGPGDFEPSNIPWAIEDGEVRVLIFTTEGGFARINEYLQEQQFGFVVNGYRHTGTMGSATVPFDLLDDLAAIDGISRVTSVSPYSLNGTADADTSQTVANDAAQADATNATHNFTISEELQAYAKSPLSRKMGTDLFRLQDKYEAYKASASKAPFSADELGMSMIGEDVVLTVNFDAVLTEQTDLSTIMARHSLQLQDLGFTVQHMAGPSLIGTVSPDLLDEIAALDEVISLWPSYVMCCAGSVTSQGDEAVDLLYVSHPFGNRIRL